MNGRKGGKPPAEPSAPGPDVVLVALGVDVPRTNRILTELTDQVRVRRYPADPQDASWAAAAAAVRASNCAIFCWSHNSGGDEADAYRRLAAEALGRDAALGIELDAGTRPPALARMTTYDVSGWRSRRAGWRSLFADKVLYSDIIAAAKAKVAGMDPPSPSAITKLVYLQIFLIAVGIAAVGGIWAFWEQIPKPRFNENAAWRALPDGSCPDLQAFRRRYPNGRYAEEARLAWESRRSIPTSKIVLVTRDTTWFADGGMAKPLRDRSAAQKLATDRAPALARAECEGFRGAAQSVLVDARHEIATTPCTQLARGWICDAGGPVHCDLKESVAGEPKDFCKLPTR